MQYNSMKLGSNKLLQRNGKGRMRAAWNGNNDNNNNKKTLKKLAIKNLT